MEFQIWADVADIPVSKCIAGGCSLICQEASKMPSRCYSRCSWFSFLFIYFFLFIYNSGVRLILTSCVVQDSYETVWLFHTLNLQLFFSFLFLPERHFNQSVRSEWDCAHWCRTYCVHPAGKCTGRTSLIEIRDKCRQSSDEQPVAVPESSVWA